MLFILFLALLSIAFARFNDDTTRDEVIDDLIENLIDMQRDVKLSSSSDPQRVVVSIGRRRGGRFGGRYGGRYGGRFGGGFRRRGFF